MDKTETYIKMCVKAEEIQKDKAPIYFDEKDFTFECQYGCGYWHQHPFWWWLPRQDQLQEMVFTHIAGTYNLLPTKVVDFADYWEENGFPLWATSLEQLWLAFVMKERFSKIWDGDDWVTQ